jgi:hypothetical protein
MKKQIKTDKILKQASQIQPIKKKDIIDKLDAFFDKNLKLVFRISLIITVLFSILLFDPRVSLTGDDSSYIISASNFIKHFLYPGFQGPLYPIFLSPFVLLFGIKLIPLKMLSVLFMMGSVYFTYKAFTGRISSFLLSVVLLLFSFNPYILYYSSQTYTEAFFMFIQAFFFYILFKYFIDKSNNPENIWENIRKHLAIAFCILLILLTKNIGFVAIIAFVGYLMLNGKWKDMLLAIVSICFVVGLFQLIKFILWGSASFNFSSQGSSLLNKNFYNPSQGKEDFAGLVNRLIENSNLYVSKHFFIILGLRPDNFGIDKMPFLTVITYLLFIAGIILVFKKNKYLLFTGIYTSLICLATFIVLQTMWDQNRLIIPYVPFLVLFLFSAIYYFYKLKKSTIIKLLLIASPIILFMTTLSRASQHVKDAQKIHGIYSGLTPDWVNYMKISKWAAENIPADKQIACRKSSISFICGNGRNFIGINNIPTYNAGSTLNDWHKNKDKYLATWIKSFSVTTIPYKLYTNLINSLSAIVLQDSAQYYLFKLPDEKKQYICNEFSKLKISYISDDDSFIKLLKKNGTYSVYFPDSLLNNLKNKRIEYVIRANLRKYPDQKTKYIINTVERYLYLIQCKYLEIFTDIAQMGDKDDEPATLTKIDYDKYNIALPPLNAKSK